MKKIIVTILFMFFITFTFADTRIATIPGSYPFKWDTMQVADVMYFHNLADISMNKYFPEYKNVLTIYCVGIAEDNKLNSEWISIPSYGYNAYSFIINGKAVIAINMSDGYIKPEDYEVLITHELAHFICYLEGKTDLNHDTPLWISLRSRVLKLSNNTIDIDASIYPCH